MKYLVIAVIAITAGIHIGYQWKSKKCATSKLQKEVFLDSLIKVVSMEQSKLIVGQQEFARIKSKYDSAFNLQRQKIEAVYIDAIRVQTDSRRVNQLLHREYRMR